MSIISSTTEYFRGAVSELRQVRWPTRNQAIRLSVITMVFTLVASIAYGVVDFILGKVILYLLYFA